MLNRNFLFFFFIIGVVSSVFAHGDLDERILLTTNEIKKDPDSAFLYFKRGKLFFQHNEYKKSLKDLKKSKSLHFEDGEQTLLFARNYFRLEKYKKTLHYADEILEKDAKNVLAIKIKAQALLKLRKYEKSALAFEDVINFTNKTFPENYIDASESWDELNTDYGNEKAMAIVEKGIGQLGELISLYDRLIELSLKQKNYKRAVDYQLHVLTLFPRKERAYYKLCELYILDENYEKASESLKLAKQHFDKLPLRIQNTSFMKELLEGIQSKENLLNQPNKI